MTKSSKLNMDLEHKESQFWLILIYSTITLSVLWAISLYIFDDGLGKSTIEIGESIGGILIMSTLLSILIAFTIQWWKQGFLSKTINLTEQKDITKFRGIDGWLRLVLIGLFATAIVQVVETYNLIKYFLENKKLINVSDYSGLIKFELIFSIIFTATAIYLIYLFLKESQFFPKYYIIFLITIVVYSVIDSAWAGEGGKELARASVIASIWCPYMIFSKRVKATFTL